ncbi:hypothetical protein M3Y96_00305300 [Aphelenchoides besseyi]|nr:hypothetical protein M3Y96_00305300 [Aphelenchoides besseyi]
MSALNLTTAGIITCRHSPSAHTVLEIALMVVIQLMMIAFLYFGVLRLWMLRLQKAALRQLRSMPHQKMLEYMSVTGRTPFERDPNPALNEKKER